MKRIIMLAVAGLAIVAVSSASAKTAHTHKAGGAAKSLTGCLEKGDDANTFKLTHVGTGADAKDWELLGAPASLKMSDHVGHKVTVSGSTVSTAGAAKMEGTKPKEEAGEHHLKVTSLKHVAPTCP
jgi:hypothetical protein